MNSTRVIFERALYREASHGNDASLVDGLRHTSNAKRYGFRNRLPKNDFKKYLFLIVGFTLFFGAFLVGLREISEKNPKQWDFQSIDTMKYSRDIGHDRLQDPSFGKEVDKQVKAIAGTGATHVAIATPYDSEFLPMLKLWVRAARRNDLKVWFRGNFSGWEGWYGYARMSPEEHKVKTREFILSNESLFEDGDLFSSCPECENGPRVDIHNQEHVSLHRQFLIEEYQIAKESFRTIGKNVGANYYSMNYDLANVMMDPETTAALDGVVVIDHYVTDPRKLAYDIREIAGKSGGKVVLGEFGAPNPQFNGQMTPQEQKQWLEVAMTELVHVHELKGVNYWVNVGGTTAIWEEDGRARPAVEVLTKVFKSR